MENYYTREMLLFTSEKSEAFSMNYENLRENLYKTIHVLYEWMQMPIIPRFDALLKKLQLIGNEEGKYEEILLKLQQIGYGKFEIENRYAEYLQKVFDQ